jgi:hypothetical protein
MMKTWIVAAGLVAAASSAAAQSDAVTTDPLRCWWRTSVAAIRVGEPFSVVLTCAVVETEAVTVVVNRMELEPDAMQLPPFDVVGGSKSDDLQTADERFFQYQYQLRLVSPDLFGKDVKLPELKISYRVRTRTSGEAVDGRDQTYILPESSVRVLSIVPVDAADIRDASPGTFDEIDRERSRATLLRLIGGVLMGFAVLAALAALVRVFGSVRARAPSTRSVLSDSAILRGVGRELAALRQARSEGGWTPAHTARLLTAVRILGSYALDLPARPAAVDGSVAGSAADGELTLRVPGLGGRDATIPGWVTPVVVADELARRQKSLTANPQRTAMLEEIQTALTQLTRAQYGREAAGANLPDQAIDEALAVADRAIGRLKLDSTWIGRKLRMFRFKTARLEHRAWSR